jgi:hypothetical protein
VAACVEFHSILRFGDNSRVVWRSRRRGRDRAGLRLSVQGTACVSSAVLGEVSNPFPCAAV